MKLRRDKYLTPGRGAGTRPGVTILYILLYFVVIFFVLLYNLKYPAINWDILGYVGLVESIETEDPQAIHGRVYQGLLDYAGIEKLDELTTGKYRHELYTNVEAFIATLSHYTRRPAYTYTVYMLSKLGFNQFFVTHAISSFFYAATCVVIFFVLKRTIDNNIYILLAAVFSIFPPLLKTAGLSTPDAMATFFFVTSSAMMIFGNFLLAIVFVFLSVLTRTDYAVYALTLCTVLMLTDLKKSRKATIFLVAAACVLSIVFIHAYYQSPPYVSLFYHTFVKLTPYPLSEEVTLSLGDYVIAFGKGVLRGFFWESIWVMVALGIWFGLPTFLRIRRHFPRVILSHSNGFDVYDLLLLANLSYIIVRFISFPVPWDRYFAGAYISVLFVVAVRLRDRLLRPIEEK